MSTVNNSNMVNSAVLVKIEKEPIKPIKLIAKCPECDKELVLGSLDAILTSYPAKYLYICPECKKKYLLDSVYPKVEYESLSKDDIL